MPSATSTVQRELASLVDAGFSLDEIDSQVLERMLLTEEQRAVLWLYAWGRLRSRHLDSAESRTRVPEVPLG
jgi:hypothetical protein